MDNNIFETLKSRKEKLRGLIDRAASFGWIDTEQKNDMLRKMDTDTLTIGVIGQMKCGKSTFLNSFVFGDTILPAATTPMTAALSVITYGEKERIVAEFYTADEWAEQKIQAARSLDEADGDAAEESKIKAAKELMSKADKLGSRLNGLLGKTQEDDFKNLIEYVGADGEYISITKSVTIYYPKEYLKGVEIVDTPGFNDPIVSREERTKDFLKRADVVLMMLYAGRPFDATDRDIIFKNVRQCGIGKVLIGINKYDIPFCSLENPEDEEKIRNYVIEEIRKACRESGDNTLNEILEDTTPIPLSAEMALLSMLPMSKIQGNEALTFAWKRHTQNFGISTQTALREVSHIDDLTNAVKNLVIMEKDKILFSKPVNTILASGATKLQEVAEKLNKAEDRITLLNMPDDELEEREENLRKAEKRLHRKISSLGDDIESMLRNIIRRGKNTLEDEVDSSCNRMRSIVENEWKRMTNFESKIKPKLDNEINTLATRKLKRSVEALADSAKRAIDTVVSEFFTDAGDILLRFLPEFDSRDFVKGVQRQIEVEIEDRDLFSVDNTSSDDEYGVLDWIGDFLNRSSFGVLKKVGGMIAYDDCKRAWLDHINDINSSFDPTPYLEAILTRKDEILSTVKSAFLDGLITPLQEQIEEIRSQKINKERDIKQCEDEIKSLKEHRDKLKEETQTIEKLKNEMM